MGLQQLMFAGPRRSRVRRQNGEHCFGQAHEPLTRPVEAARRESSGTWPITNDLALDPLNPGAQRIAGQLSNIEIELGVADISHSDYAALRVVSSNRPAQSCSA